MFANLRDYRNLGFECFNYFIMAELKTREERLTYFDWIRGLMILWMLIYHISLNYGKVVFGVPEDGASVFTFMSFFMATFYVSSGYFFSTKRAFDVFLRDKIKRVVVPYITFSFWGILVFECYCLVTSGHLGDLHLMDSIWTGCVRQNGPLWFLFSLFFCGIIYYGISKVGEGKVKHLIVLIVFLLAYLTHNRGQIFSSGNIALGLTFFHLGFCLRQYKETLNHWYWGVLALLIYFSLGLFAPSRLEFVRNLMAQGNWFINYIFTVSACFLLWYISQLWKHNNIAGRGLVFLGRDSLVVFAFHRPVLNWVIEPVVRAWYPSIRYSEFLIICLIGILLMYIMLNTILKTYFPKLIGRQPNSVVL